MQEARGLHGEEICVGTIRASSVCGMTVTGSHVSDKKAGPAPLRGHHWALLQGTWAQSGGHRERSLAYWDTAWGGALGQCLLYSEIQT